jgi:hypothetical protein
LSFEKTIFNAICSGIEMLGQVVVDHALIEKTKAAQLDRPVKQYSNTSQAAARDTNTAST